MNKSEHEIIHDHFSKLAKKSHRVSPRSREKYAEMGRISAAKKKLLKLARQRT